MMLSAGGLAHPEFGVSVNPILTGGQLSHYCTKFENLTASLKGKNWVTIYIVQKLASKFQCKTVWSGSFAAVVCASVSIL